MMKSVVIFISGNGSNLQKLIDTINNSIIKIELVVSNRKKAYGLERAKIHDIPTLYFPYLRKKMDRIEYDLELANRVKTLVPKIDFIFCLGWMHVLSKEFINSFPEKTLINLHPALPGQFPGKDAITEAFNYYKKHPKKIMNTGAMIHYVIPEIDAGEVIDTINIPIYTTDTLETLRYRVQFSEKELLLRAIQEVVKNSFPTHQ